MLVLTYAKRTNKQKRLKEAEDASDTLSTLCALMASGNTHMCVSHHSRQYPGPDLLSVLPTIFSASLSFDEMPASLVGPHLLNLETVGDRMGFHLSSSIAGGYCI